MTDITLDNFIRTIFDTPLDPDERVLLAVNDGGWASFPVTPRRLSRFKPGVLAWYFGVCTYDEPDATGYMKRGRDQTRWAYCLVLDDIGTKAATPPVAPSWALESSPGNFQYGYLIEAIDVRDKAQEAFYESCQHSLCRAGYGDEGACGTYRVMRVPGSLHKTGFVSVITQWNPEREWPLADLMVEMGVEVKTKRTRSDTPGVAATRAEIEDPVFDWLEANGRVLEFSRGLAHIKCFADHEPGGASSTSYRPASPGQQAWFKCQHDTCIQNEHKTAWFLEQVAAAQQAEAGDDPVWDIVLRNEDEDGVALYAAQALAGQYVYLHGAGEWYGWAGGRWARDERGMVREEIRGISRRHNSNNGKTLAKASFVSGVLNHLKHDPAMARLMEDYDVDNYLLGTPGGVYDLRAGTLRPGRPEDLITLQTAVGPLEGVGVRFERFIDEITDGDADLARFLQMSLGACLSGAREEHWIMFWTGTGRNGKNTLGELVEDILGDYSGTIQSSTLMATKQHAHAAELMQLKGKRLIVSSEIQNSARWDEARINQVTGDSTIAAHYMGQNWVEFQRTHKHVVYGNARPALDNVTPAIKARIKVVPFNVSFLGREDPDLADELWGEAGQVLTWLIAGHEMWLANGKRLPKVLAVEGETREYFGEQATLEVWLDEECQDTRNSAHPTCTLISLLHMEFSKWMQARGAPSWGMNTFSAAMKRHYSKKRVSAGMIFIGVELLTAPTGQNLTNFPEKV